MQAADAEFGGLFDQPVDLGTLHRSEHEGEIGYLLERFGGVLHRQGHALLARFADPREPFTVGAVEQQDLTSNAEPEHVAEVVGLTGIQVDRGADT